eukprot:m.32657 g.32657  ORF g.32657 m.32657 type:complete len:498 (-) comp8435_c0_seq1:62-1555(-)
MTSWSVNMEGAPLLQPSLTKQLVNGQYILGHDRNESIATLKYKLFFARACFCLITFGDCVTALVLYILLQPRGPGKVKESLEHYTMKNSLADLAALAMFRFLLLNLIYTIMKHQKILPLILLSIASAAFLVAKIYITRIDEVHPTTYLLYIQGFVFPWGATWFYSARVLTVSRVLTEIMGYANTSEPSQPQDSSTPNRSRDATQTPDPQKPRSYDSDGMDESLGYRTPISDIESDAFGTPESTPPNSPAEVRPKKMSSQRSSSSSMVQTITRPERASSWSNPEYQQEATKGIDVVFKLASDNDINWRFVTEKGGITVSSAQPNNGETEAGGVTLLKTECDLACSPSVLHHLLLKNIQKQASWNPLVTDYEVVCILDRYTDITYGVMPSLSGGLISPRDFVCVRRWMIKGGTFMIAETSCQHPSKLPAEEYVRCSLGPTGYVLQPIHGRPHETHLVWIFQIDLKGNLPPHLVDQTFANLLIEHQEAIRHHVEAGRAHA